MHHAHLAEAINAGRPAATQMLDALQGSGLGSTQSLAMIDRMINAQAYVMSADDIFYASAVIFLLLIPLVWLARPARGPAIVDGGAAD